MDLIHTNEISRPLYSVIENLFSAHPFFQWICIGLVTAALLGLLLYHRKWVDRFPPYSYMAAVLVTLAMLDILTQNIPMLTVYVIILGYVLLLGKKENPYVVGICYAATYLLIDLFTVWGPSSLVQLTSYAVLFYWISWMSVLVRRSYSEEKRVRDRNQELEIQVKTVNSQLAAVNEGIRKNRHDSLTDLYNFDGFQEQVTQGLESVSNKSFYVICLDIVDFRQINLKKGTDFGDRVLLHIARYLKRHFPSMSPLARYDGDQFAIGVTGDHTALRHSLEMIEHIMSGIQIDSHALQYCVGTSCYPQEATSSAELIRVAEQKLSVEQKRIRDKEEVRRQHLEKLSAVGQLAAGLAHEIRNPLTSIRGFVQLSAAESELVQKMEPTILSEIDRINDLLKQFLNLSESKPARFSKFSLDQLVNDILSLLQHESFLKGHELKAYAPVRPIELEGDSEQIKQVLINLIKNGLEALRENGKVEVMWKELPGRVSIRIEDNGSGIRPENLSRIFDPFFTTKGDNGTGMGLSICHRIITEHGGQVHVTSQPGGGTAFHIQLPLRQNVKDRLDVMTTTESRAVKPEVERIYVEDPVVENPVSQVTEQRSDDAISIEFEDVYKMFVENQEVQFEESREEIAATSVEVSQDEVDVEHAVEGESESIGRFKKKMRARKKPMRQE